MIDTPRGWLMVFADQRYWAQPGAEDSLRYVDARGARTMVTRIWHAEDIAYRLQINEDEDLALLMTPKPVRHSPQHGIRFSVIAGPVGVTARG